MTEQEDIRTSSRRVNQLQEKMKPKLCCLDFKLPGRSAVSLVSGAEMLAALAHSPAGRSLLKEKILQATDQSCSMEAAMSPRRLG